MGNSLNTFVKIEDGEEKAIHIEVPEGYEIDKENSTLEYIKFKPVNKSKFSDYDGSFRIKGWRIGSDSEIYSYRDFNISLNRDLFATEKYTKSALAMAQISQIMVNDERFGGVITDEEWDNFIINKYCIVRCNNKLCKMVIGHYYYLLAFHTEEQRDLFLEENEDLVKDYLMID